MNLRHPKPKPEETKTKKPPKVKDDKTQRRIERLLAKRANLEGEVFEINRRLGDLGYSDLDDHS